MFLKFRLEMDVIIDQDCETKVIELPGSNIGARRESPPLTTTDDQTGSRLRN
jgi:hypothetical protein